MKKLVLALFSFSLIVLLSCAARTRISDINNSPRRFYNKVVSVSGIVENTITLPILNVGIYQIDDGSGKLWIKPQGQIPFEGDRVTATGKIKVGLSISGKNFGVILIESKNDEYY